MTTPTGQMSLGQARIVDPVLSTVALGYRLPEAVGENLFPRVPVALRGGKVIQFGKEAFKKYNTARAPGSATGRIQFGYEGVPFSIVPNALEAPVPRELQQDALVMPGIDLGTRAVNLVMRSNILALEVEQAGIALTAASYDSNHKVALAGTSQWSDYSGTSDPSNDVQTWREAVRTTTGAYPNTMVLGAAVLRALRQHPKILDRVKYSGRDAITTEILQALWEIPKIRVGTMVSSDDAGVFSDVWGKNVVLAYVPAGPSTQEEPSYGYTYTYAGHPTVEQPYWEPQTKSWIYGVSFDRSTVMTGILAGFLGQTVVA
jgi:hypothetical protein